MKSLIFIVAIVCIALCLSPAFAANNTKCEASNCDASDPDLIELIDVPVEVIHFNFTPADLEGLNDFERDAALLAQVIHGEANGLPLYDKSMVAWDVLNRLDMGIYGSSIYEVISAPNQFHWRDNFQITAENYKLATDVLTRYYCELNGWFYSEESSGRTLPRQFVNFTGNGKVNTFRDRAGNVYTRYLKDPYEVN